MKTVILGNSGSGKTWLARRLSQQTAASVVHLDDLFWMPGRFDNKRPGLERNMLIDAAKAY